MKGNREGDDPASTTLDDAISSLVTFFDENEIEDAILVGHSWGGFPITGAADRLAAGRIRRLVYFSAFVPNDGESAMDLVPPAYKARFEEMAAESKAGTFPFPVLREAFVNDGTYKQAQDFASTLVPQPFRTFADPISLSRNPAAFEIGKSYLLALEDTAMPHSMPWHPRLSEKLGLYRLVTMPGSHCVHVTAPERLAQKIMEAARD
ncbi:MAG: alpha/beta hydrolase [Breoghania sp.]|nr:alpha/beta hydrolase [Breoghania sp.]